MFLCLFFISGRDFYTHVKHLQKIIIYGEDTLPIRNFSPIRGQGAGVLKSGMPTVTKKLGEYFL